METFIARLTGRAPLLMHNGQLANPRNAFAASLSEVTKGKSKNLIAAERIEFLGGLYVDGSGEPCITGDMIYACIVNGATAAKNGKEMRAGMFEAEPTYPLLYDGPRDPEALFLDGRFNDYRGVGVQRNRVMRSRPIFREWEVVISVFVNTEIIQLKQVRQAIERAGLAVGLGDYRPRFGRFTVEALS